MGYNSRFFALILASVIAFFTTGFLYITDKDAIIAMVVVASVSFGISFIFIYLAFEFLIFKEVNDLHEMMLKLRNNELIKRLPPNRRKTSNPIKKLNQEFHNITFNKQLEIDELKRMEEYRREFLANVSHELKTPIFSAQGFIQTLIDGAIKDKEVRNKFLKKASKSLDSLNVLVQDLLTISQLESGEIIMHKDYFDIQRMTRDIFELLDRKTKRRNYQLKINATSDAPIEVYGDPQRIEQVMTNLIDNAIKYGKENGSVTVSFKSTEKETTVRISDDGPGIEAAKVERIFERFYRVDKHRSREFGGTGLGLSIVKHIIESHDSSIKVSSELEKGTTFEFSLPNE